MRVSSKFVLLCILQAASVYGRSGSRSESGSSSGSRSNKDNGGKDKNRFNNGGGNRQQSALSNFLGNFRTVIDILKTGNATELAQSSE